VTPDEDATPRRAGRVDWLLVAYVAMASAPIVIGCWWAAAHHWIPTGDRAFIALNGDRVLSAHTPTVGMPSTLPVEQADGSAPFVNHLGPMEFWALSVPSLLGGGSTIALLVGVALVNIGSIVLAAWAAVRTLSRAAAGWYMTGCVVLSVGLGLPLLWDNWNPHITIFPLVALLMVASAVVAGHRWFLPWAVLLAVFIAQVHLSTVLIGLVVGAWCLAAGLWQSRRGGGPGVLRRWRGPLLAGTGVIAATWLLPVANEVDSGRGNLTLLIQSMGQGREQTGPSYAIAMLGRLGSLQPLWLQRATGVFDLPKPTVLDRMWTVVLLGLFVAVLVGAIRTRAADAGRFAVLTTAAVVLVASFADLAMSPSPPVGISYIRWLWAVGLFVWFATGYGVVSFAGEHLRAQRPDLAAAADDRSVVRMVLAMPLVVGLLLVPVAASDPDLPPPDAADDWRALGVLSDQVEASIEGRSVFLAFHGVDAAFSGGPAVWRALDARGVDVRVPANYNGGTSGVWGWEPGEPIDLAAGVYGERTGHLVPREVPIAVLGIGLDDRAQADEWVAAANRLLGELPPGSRVVLDPATDARLRTEARPDADPDAPVEDQLSDRAKDLDRMLGDARLAMFDREVVRAIAEGRATRSPISPSDAAALLAGLDEADFLAVGVPVPTAG